MTQLVGRNTVWKIELASHRGKPPCIFLVRDIKDLAKGQHELDTGRHEPRQPRILVADQNRFVELAGFCGDTALTRCHQDCPKAPQSRSRTRGWRHDV